MENILFAIELEKRPNAVVNQRLDQRRAKAAIVFRIVDEQRGARRHHRGEMRVIDIREQICSVLFEVAQVAVSPGFHLGRG